LNKGFEKAGLNQGISMARMTLKLPVQFPFSTDIAVRISDINYAGHLGHDAIVSLIHEARVRFLKTHGFTELDIDGFGLVMTDLTVMYKTEVFHGEVLTIGVSVHDVTKNGFDFVYRVISRETGKEVARARTGVMFFDYGKRRLVGIPKGFKAAFMSHKTHKGNL
jgi:4-hydroxybenzoyl-CoA thioesterase